MTKRLITRGALALALLTLVAGCETQNSAVSTLADQQAELTLREGDVVQISFPGARDLDPPGPLTIRRDGKITLPIVGEVTAAGQTPSQLQDALLKLFANQLLSKEVIVTVVSSSFDIFVDGAVLRSGKITSTHPITVLEAVMEAGGFDYDKADTKKIVIIRQKQGSKNYDYYTVDLQLVLDGKQTDRFYLAPGDIVHVGQKFTWF